MSLAKKLQKGDTIGVISPSNFVDNDDKEIIKNSKKLLEDSGFKVKFSKHCFENTTKYGATAKEKAEDIMDMYKDDTVKAIISLKGGFNSNSVYEHLDLDEIKNHNKILCGYSDATSYINYIVSKTGNIGFIGPNFKTLTSSETKYCFNNFIDKMCNGSKNLLQSDDECKVIYPLKQAMHNSVNLDSSNSNLVNPILANSSLANSNLENSILANSSLENSANPNFENQNLQKGNTIQNYKPVSGELIGGNLSLISELADILNFDGKILFLEELSFETPPQLASNYIYNLKQKGVFNKIKGLWLGNYEGEISIEKIVLDSLEEINFPIIKSNNFGHTERIMSIPIGAQAEINGNNIRITNDFLM